jgi:hypothetical protein
MILKLSLYIDVPIQFSCSSQESEYWHTQTGLNLNYFIKDSEYWHTQTGLNLNYLIKESEYWHTQTGLNLNYLIQDSLDLTLFECVNTQDSFIR